jgi:SNF2 family DNA or RNA helicase
MATRLFRAIEKLNAKYRWCLTGTPVQNSLDDLASLLSFVQVSPLDNLNMFRKHIISPIKNRSETGVENLRQVLDFVCLRRTQELLNLPKITSELKLLKFSNKEEQLYSSTRTDLINKIKENTFKPNSKGSQLGVFQLQLQLRRLCNHGTFQKPSIREEGFDPQQAMRHLETLKEANCEVCNHKITGINGIEEQWSGISTTCGHLLCSICLPNVMKSLNTPDISGGLPKCSLCAAVVVGDYLATELSTSRSVNYSKRISPLEYFDTDGYSSKVSAVIEDIKQQHEDEKRYVTDNTFNI